MELANLIAAEMPGEQDIVEEDGHVTIYATVNAVKVTVTVAVDDETFLMLMVAGPDSATLDTIIDSLRDAD